METTRRDLPFWLTALASTMTAAELKALTSQTWRYEDLPVKESGENRSRAVFDGASHNGYPIDMHETELGPGMAPHPPHRHAHHELLIMREGIVEVTIEGKSTVLGPGGVGYVASNDFHGWRNTGTTRARYYVIALGRQRA